MTSLQTHVLEQGKHATNNNNNHHIDAVERRVTFMVACMIGAYLTAWTPYSIMALIETFGGVSTKVGGDDTENDGGAAYVGSISPAMATVPSLFAKTSAVLNPLIYGLLNTQVCTQRRTPELLTNRSRWLIPRTVPLGLGAVLD